MKVLVTGSEGFIGKHVVKELELHDHEVICFDKKLGHNILYQNSRFPECDVIVHLAALIDVEDSFYDWENYYLTNVIGTGLLPKNKRIIFASSAAVYGKFSPYGESKIMAEKLLPENSVIFRIFNPFGPGENHKPETHLIPKLMSGKAKVYNNGNQIRNFIHVKDVAHAFRLAVESKVIGTFDLCSDYPLRVNEVIELMKVDVDYIDNPRDEGDTQILNGDNTLLKHFFKWQSHEDTRESLKNWREWDDEKREP